MRYTGCAYYPKYWGPERVETDAALMREAGINMVRIGEFAWNRMEPREGRYTLDWLHDAVDVLGQFGISVMMCTPAAAPPAWLTSKHPEMLLATEGGKRSRHGARRHYCHTSAVYREYCLKIADQLSREMAAHDQPATVDMGGSFAPIILGTIEQGLLRLPPFGVCIVGD